MVHAFKFGYDLPTLFPSLIAVESFFDKRSVYRDLIPSRMIFLYEKYFDDN